jgi:hypothetical protein
MEIFAVIAALAVGHHYLTQDEPVVPQTQVSAQTTTDVANFGTNDVTLAQIDWSKAGNFRVGSSDNSVQWVIITN